MFRQLTALSAFIIFALLLCFPSLAIAASDENALQRTTGMVVEVLTPVLVLVATWLAHRFISAFEKKTGIDIPAAQEVMIDKLINDGIHWAEEKSRSKIKAAEAKLTGPEKLEAAADFVLTFVEGKKYPEWTRDKVKGKIEAKLGIRRAADAKPVLDDGEK